MEANLIVGLVILVIFFAAAAVMFTRTLPALLVLPVMALGIAGSTALITGELSFRDINEGVIAAGAFRLHEAIIVAMFGGIISFMMQKSGVAESLVKNAAELIGDNPLGVSIFAMGLVSLLFTSIGGLGAIIMVAMVVLPMLATVGVPPVAAGGIMLFGISVGGILNAGTWVLYANIVSIPVEEVRQFALMVFFLSALAGVTFIVVELYRGGVLRSVKTAIAVLTGVGVLAVLVAGGIILYSIIWGWNGGEAVAAEAAAVEDVAPAIPAWLVYSVRSIFAVFFVVVLGIATYDHVAKVKHWRQQIVEVKWYAYLIPIMPLILIIVFDVAILAAFFFGLLYAIYTTLRPGTVNMTVQCMINGSSAVLPAALLMLGIGILLNSILGPVGWSAANASARVVKVDLVREQRIASLPLHNGDLPAGALITFGERRGFLGTDSVPGRVIELNLDTFERAGEITLPAGEDRLVSGAVGPGGEFAYFGTNTTPGRVVKIELEEFERADALTLPLGENELRVALMAPEGDAVYFATSGYPARLVRIDLETFERTDSLLLEEGEGDIVSGFLSPEGDTAYLATRTSPGRLVRVDLESFERVDSIVFEDGEDNPASVAVSRDGAFAYFGTDTVPARVVQVDMRSFERTDALVIEDEAVQEAFVSAVMAQDGTAAWFGTAGVPGHLVKVDLEPFEHVSTVALRPGEDRPASVVLSPDGNFAYFGTAVGEPEWPVNAAIEPVINEIVPGNRLLYVLVFVALAPLALYRGPLNMWGLGSGVAAILILGDAMTGAAVMAMILTVGMIQGICDPTNTHNVWLANELRVDVQTLMWRTLPYVWGMVVVGLTVSAFINF